MIVSAMTLPVINRMGGDQAAWIKITFIDSVVAMGMLLWCFFGTKERVNTQAAQEAETMPISVRLGALFRDKYSMMILLSSLSLAVHQTVNGTCATWYSQYIPGNSEYYGVLNLAENLPQIIVIMLLPPFIQKFGKRNLVLAGAGLTLAAQISLAFVPANLAYAAVVAAMRGIGKAPLFGCVFTMMADIVNCGHWKTGIRVQALVFSAATVGQKFGGITGWAIGKLMDASGFTGLVDDIPSAVSMVQNLYAWGAVLAWAVIVALMLLYHLDKEYDGIISDMERKGLLKQAA